MAYHVFGVPNTRSVRAVWALEEIGQDYAYTAVDLRSGGADTPAFRAANPLGKVPTLVHDDGALSESGAIVTWLGERHPRSGLVPMPESPERAGYLQWMSFCVTELEQPLWTIAKHSFALPKAHRVEAIKDTARFEFERPSRVLAGRLDGREFAAGASFSGADIVLAHTLSWAREALGNLDSDVLEDYATRMLARPALARARQREAATNG